MREMCGGRGGSCSFRDIDMWITAAFVLGHGDNLAALTFR